MVASWSLAGSARPVILLLPMAIFAVIVPNVVSVPCAWRFVMASDKAVESANFEVAMTADAFMSALRIAPSVILAEVTLESSISDVPIV